MKNLLQNNKNIIVTIIIFGIAFAVFKFINVPSITTTESLDTNVIMAGKDVVDLSNSISSAKLNISLFSFPSYRILKDFSTEIPVQPKGRNNPFAVIGSDSGVISTSASTLATSTKR